ncbi:MAG: GDSL-type esterase/lipase family protein [Planctomycetota bacterium]
MKNIARFSTILAVTVCLALLSVVQAQEKKDQPKPSPGLVKLTAKTTPLLKGDKIAFFGDSVTMQGGYIDMIAAALKESPATSGLGVELIKHGLDGGRVPTVLEGNGPFGNLGGTMEVLLEREKPTVVVVFLGINDVWHGEKGTTKPDFEAGLKTMIELIRKNGGIPVLCTPTVIGEEMTDENVLTAKLGEYGEITRKLAKDGKIALVDLHKAFVDTLKRLNQGNKHSGVLTYDGVHMAEAGNAIIADQMSGGLVEALNKRPRATPAAKKLTIKGTCLFGGRTGTWSGVLTPTSTAGVYDVEYVAAWGGSKAMTYSGQVKTDLKTEVSGNGKATGGGGNGTFEFSGKFGANGVAKCPYAEVGGSRKRSGTLTVDSIK